MWLPRNLVGRLGEVLSDRKLKQTYKEHKKRRCAQAYRLSFVHVATRRLFSRLSLDIFHKSAKSEKYFRKTLDKKKAE